MSDNAEYNRLVNQKQTAQGQYNACANRIGDYDYLLRRLKQKKEWVADLKEAYKDHKKATQKIHDEDHDWKGSTYRSFSAKMDSVESADERYYKYTLDYVLDSLNNEITRIENLRMNEYGLLGQLGSKINSLVNKIENFFN